MEAMRCDANHDDERHPQLSREEGGRLQGQVTGHAQAVSSQIHHAGLQVRGRAGSVVALQNERGQGHVDGQAPAPPE